jgi:hypothetical protein
MEMSLPSVALNEDVIEEDQNKLLEVRLQECIHETLEGIWGIAKSKRHYREFIMAFMSPKSSLQDIYFIHPYLVIVIVKV